MHQYKSFQAGKMISIKNLMFSAALGKAAVAAASYE
jgi:hypothetical protein